MTGKEIRLSECIGHGFYEIHRDIRQGGHTHYWIKGGRGSGKSSFLSIEIMLGLLEDREANAVALRKVAANLKDSVIQQMAWAVQMLGVAEDCIESVTVPLDDYTSLTCRMAGRGTGDG